MLNMRILGALGISGNELFTALKKSFSDNELSEITDIFRHDYILKDTDKTKIELSEIFEEFIVKYYTYKLCNKSASIMGESDRLIQIFERSGDRIGVAMDRTLIYLSNHGTESHPVSIHALFTTSMDVTGQLKIVNHLLKENGLGLKIHFSDDKVLEKSL